MVLPFVTRIHTVNEKDRGRLVEQLKSKFGRRVFDFSFKAKWNATPEEVAATGEMSSIQRKALNFIANADDEIAV